MVAEQGHGQGEGDAGEEEKTFTEGMLLGYEDASTGSSSSSYMDSEELDEEDSGEEEERRKRHRKHKRPKIRFPDVGDDEEEEEDEGMWDRWIMGEGEEVEDMDPFRRRKIRYRQYATIRFLIFYRIY